MSMLPALVFCKFRSFAVRVHSADPITSPASVRILTFVYHANFSRLFAVMLGGCSARSNRWVLQFYNKDTR